MSKTFLGLCSLLVCVACAASPKPPAAPSAASIRHIDEQAPDMHAFLGNDAKRAQLAGAKKPMRIAFEPAAGGDRVAGLIELPKGQCALLLARGSETVEDLDIFAYGEDGTAFGSDEAPDRTPSLIVCTEQERRLYVAARVAAGHGLVLVAAQALAKEHVQAVGKAVGTRNIPGSGETSEAWPGLEEALQEHRRAIGARWQDLRRVALPVDARVPTSISVDVAAGRCVDALALPSDEVAHLEVIATESSGRIVGRASASGRTRSLIVCSPVAQRLTFQVRPHAGRGLAVLILSQSIPNTEADIDQQALRFDVYAMGDAEGTRQAHNERLEQSGHPSATIAGRGRLELGRRSSVPVELAGVCQRIDVWSQEPLKGIEAWLWSDSGELLAHERGGVRTTLFACAPDATARQGAARKAQRAATARLDLEALVRPGEFLVEVRPEPDLPEVLRQHPLAASRLLSRMHERGVIRRSSQVGAPRVVRVGPNRLETVDVVVPVGRCVDMTLALSSGGLGAEIRVVDRANEIEVMLARGTHATSARACALDRPDTLNARVELRAAADDAVGLFATHMLSPRK